MSLRLSTGLRNKMLGTDGFKGALALGSIAIFSGAIPTNADTTEGSCVKLVVITKDGGALPAAGLSLDDPDSGTISKASETWQGNGLAGGTASWFRYYGATIITGDSVTAVRLDGTVGTSNADLILSSITIVSGVPVTIDVAKFTLPVS